MTALRIAISVAVVGALAACPVWGGDAARTTLIVFAYYAALAQMWNLLAGYAGLVSFGQQLFIGLGGYTLAVGCERLGLGVWTAFALAAVVTGALAIPVGALTFRLKGGYFAVGSWSSSAATRRIASRSIVSRAACAVGMTRQPSLSSATSSCVAIASISGTIRCGFSCSTTRRSAARSSMSITWLRCATCIAGASA